MEERGSHSALRDRTRTRVEREVHNGYRSIDMPHFNADESKGRELQQHTLTRIPQP